MLFFFCVLTLVAQSYGQLHFSENCPDITPRNTDFEVSDILGDWYEAYRYDERFEHDHKCVNIKYYLDEQGDLIEQANSTIAASGATYVWRGKLLPLEERPGVYRFVFNQYARDQTLKATLVAFNKDSHAILHACGQDQNDGTLRHFLWVWSKSTSLAQSDEQDVAQVLRSKLNVNINDLTRVDFNNCPPRRDYPN